MSYDIRALVDLLHSNDGSDSEDEERVKKVLLIMWCCKIVLVVTQKEKQGNINTSCFCFQPDTLAAMGPGDVGPTRNTLEKKGIKRP